MCNLGELVDDDENGVMTLLRLWKTSNEIHLHFIPFPQRNRERLQNTSRLLMFCLHTTANIAFRNIASDVLLHPRPPIPLMKITIHFGATRMNRQWCIMCFLHDFVSHKLEARYNNAVSEVQGSIFRQREIPVLFQVKIFLHEINFSIFRLRSLDSFLKIWFNNQGF